MELRPAMGVSFVHDRRFRHPVFLHELYRRIADICRIHRHRLGHSQRSSEKRPVTPGQSPLYRLHERLFSDHPRRLHPAHLYRRAISNPVQLHAPGLG